MSHSRFENVIRYAAIGCGIGVGLNAAVYQVVQRIYYHKEIHWQDYAYLSSHPPYSFSLAHLPGAIIGAMSGVIYGYFVPVQILQFPVGSFEERLISAGHADKQGLILPIPEWMKDPCTLNIFEDPVRLVTLNMTDKNFSTGCNVDKQTLSMYNRKECPVSRDVFTGYLENTNLKKAIDYWIKQVELKLEPMLETKKSDIASISTTNESFMERIQAANYTGTLPDWALDPVTGKLMNKPVILNVKGVLKACTVDESTVAVLNGKCPYIGEFKGREFEGYGIDRELHGAIDWLVHHIELKMKLERVNILNRFSHIQPITNLLSFFGSFMSHTPQEDTQAQAIVPYKKTM